MGNILPGQKVSVEISYVAELASYVEKKLRAASDAAPASDMLGLTVLAALNLADEYFRARDHQAGGANVLNERALELEALVDQALDPAS